MKRALFVMVAVVLLWSAWTGARSGATGGGVAAAFAAPGDAPAQPATPPGMPPAVRPPGMGMPGRPPGGMMAAPVDSFAADRDSLMNEVLQHIAGRENAPAESVFKNIKMLKGVPAGRVLRIMNMGWGRSLGVNCTHCHVLGHWADEDKPQKQVARDMGAMVGRINEELLPAIKNLRSDHPGVNCGTCHHGTARPGTGPMQQMQQSRPPETH